MNFQIHALEGQIDQLAIQRALMAVDESVIVNLDPFTGRLGIAGRLGEDEAILALRGAGYRIEPIAASECCGGCG